jgi:hypothetical protein
VREPQSHFFEATLLCMRMCVCISYGVRQAPSASLLLMAHVLLQLFIERTHEDVFDFFCLIKLVWQWLNSYQLIVERCLS